MIKQKHPEMKAQRLDRITTLPETIIETVLCLLPIEEAARTSILSREWRYKWTTIPKLVFRRCTVKTSTEEGHLSDRELLCDLSHARREEEMKRKLFYAIYQVLLLHQGPIQEFILTMNVHDTCFEMDQILLHLSRKHMVLKLTLELNYFTLPLSLFSLHQLTDLSLYGCQIKHVPVFNGFGSLTSLSLEMVWISMESLLHLLSLCPSLKSFILLTTSDLINGGNNTTIMEFFECLPVIEHLTTSCYLSEYGLHVSVPEELPNSLIHLKYFCFKEMMVEESDEWTFLSVLIHCSPNLEKIKLEMLKDVDDCFEESITFEEYSDFWLEHLNELEIEGFRNYKTELDFVKVILARSPNLKKVVLRTWMHDKDKELETLTILLSAPCASPVKIIVKNDCRAQP
ncbi:putative FBD domain, F-box-like domain superfamily protein [Helianthus annuus]|nr:putative FBD domain, F-box-like domain superfamily protein [Helianthus annuus]KAJ0825598.1 putative FBD domain, F-box-like domain superfamily protein [Helianthus annuus]